MISKGSVEKTPLNSILAPSVVRLQSLDKLINFLGVFFICHTTHRDCYGDVAIWGMLLIKMTTDTICITFSKNQESHYARHMHWPTAKPRVRNYHPSHSRDEKTEAQSSSAHCPGSHEAEAARLGPSASPRC